jgi:hypothetical protein
LVKNYMNRLRAALAGLPEGRRDEITEAVAQHIVDAWIELFDESEAAIRTMLDHLGEPEDIAADALEIEAISIATAPLRPELRVSRKVLITSIAVLGVSVGGIVGGLALSGAPTPPRSTPPTTIVRTPATVTVPNVLGLSGASASTTLLSAGLRIIVQAVAATPGNPPGLLVRQSPSAGARVPIDSTVTVAVVGASAASSTTTIMSPTTTTP